MDIKNFELWLVENELSDNTIINGFPWFLQLQHIGKEGAMYTKYAKLRDAKGLNDNKVAEMTGIPASTIYDWKQRSEKDGKASLSFENTVRIAKLFEISVDYFVEEEG